MRAWPADGVIERMVGRADPTPIPAGPSHCVCGCGRELEPLRRRGGYARECMRLVKVAGLIAVRVIGEPAPTKNEPQQHGGTLYRIVRKLRAKRGGRPRVIVRCQCGARKTMTLTAWKNRTPKCCNKCRLRGIGANGFEAEHG